MMETIEQRVDNGIRLFDREVPGWEESIDQPISLTSFTTCPGGQVFGDFKQAVNALNLSWVRTSRYALCCSDAEATQMNAEWERRIKARRDEQREVVEDVLQTLEHFVPNPRIPTRA